MKSVHLVIPDLFLPQGISTDASADLHLPALEKILARGRSEILPASAMENLLCELFGFACTPDAPVAAISAAFDGLAEGYWLRADPVNMNLQRDRMVLSGVTVDEREAEEICASLNAHFAGHGMEFFAPHPLRWYVRLETLPRIRTTPLSEVIGGDIRRALPTGEDEARWHQLFNEIQMLLHTHPRNEAREARGKDPVNSVWFWGGGNRKAATSHNKYENVQSDEVLVEMFAAAADIPFAALPGKWEEGGGDGSQLLVWNGLRAALQRGDLAAWRDSLRDFESGYALPSWQALRSGKLEHLEVVVPGGESTRRVTLKRTDTWAFWRSARRLAEYSLV